MHLRNYDAPWHHILISRVHEKLRTRASVSLDGGGEVIQFQWIHVREHSKQRPLHLIQNITQKPPQTAARLSLPSARLLMQKLFKLCWSCKMLSLLLQPFLLQRHGRHSAIFWGAFQGPQFRLFIYLGNCEHRRLLQYTY